MVEETLKPRNPLAAPLIFFTVVCFHVLCRFLEHLKKRGGKNSTEMQLRAEIKQLLKEANSHSQPSTFALAAKLRRVAAAKEKELEKNLTLFGKEKNSPFDLCLKVVAILKAFTYLLLVWSFWGVPVTIISKQLVQPFGKVLSWTAGNPLHDKVAVGIIPWLMLSTRVIKFISKKVIQ